jgi:hypothetical protein
MSILVYRIHSLLTRVLADVPLGTNLGLLHLLFALISGHFLASRGAVFPALDRLGLAKESVRRSAAALAYGRWHIQSLLDRWQESVLGEERFVASRYEGVRPVACDLTGFFRPQLQGCVSKHYVSEAGKALPAVLVGMVGAVGHVGTGRLALPRLLVSAPPEATSDAALEKHLITRANHTLADDEALVADAGFELADLLAAEGRFVVRLAKNFTARYNYLPDYAGRGRHSEYGSIVRPLARERAGKRIKATPPQSITRWKDGSHCLEAWEWSELVMRSERPGASTFRVVAIFDPRYKEPLLLATNLSVSPEALWRLYKDRWPIEQLPLAAKAMLGAGRAFVSGRDSRERLPQLALLAGNLLSYVAATSAPVASGFWDRHARPTCGRLRRVLSQVHFSQVPLPQGQLRKKNSVTAHLVTGVNAHRRTNVGTQGAGAPNAA